MERVLRGAAKILTSNNGSVGHVYFPVFAANPNSGVTYGFLPVTLLTDDRNHIRHIFAPMITYNSNFGVGLSGTYYYYPSDRARLRAVLEKSQISDYQATASYENLNLSGGRYVLTLDAGVKADGAMEFYGVGPATTKGDESSYRLLERSAQAEWGVRLPAASLVLSGGWKVRRDQVEPGVISAPKPFDPRLETVTTDSLPYVRLSRDTRDEAYTPARGSFAELSAEDSSRSWGGDSDYRRLSGQWRLYQPVSDHVTAALHAQTEWEDGAVPFTALSSLGGARSLRGFAYGRFQDKGLVFANLEARWTILSLKIVNAMTEFQIAPFLETGTVAPSPGEVQARRFENVVGTAFRAVVKPSVVGKVEVGVGREGPAVFVGIDYPF